MVLISRVCAMHPHCWRKSLRSASRWVCPRESTVSEVCNKMTVRRTPCYLCLILKRNSVDNVRFMAHFWSLHCFLVMIALFSMHCRDCGIFFLLIPWLEGWTKTRPRLLLFDMSYFLWIYQNIAWLKINLDHYNVEKLQVKPEEHGT